MDRQAQLRKKETFRRLNGYEQESKSGLKEKIMPEESILNSSKPNAGRIYDYLLDGNHNFEADRIAGEQLKAMLPFITKLARLQRWCLQDLAVELTEKRGYEVIIDFASGLPTQDHIHETVRPGTVVIYSDLDPVVVEYGRDILQGRSNVYFFHGDARRPDELLGRPEVQKILAGRRDVALVYWAVAAFMKDEELAFAAQYLHQWAGPRSCWAFNAQGANTDSADPAMMKMVKLYEQMGSPLYSRSLDQYQTLIQPWHTGEAGFVSFLDWHGLDQSEMSQDDRNAFGPSSSGYGAYLVK
jgi:SAM-dependent methyltransferase